MEWIILFIYKSVSGHRRTMSSGAQKSMPISINLCHTQTLAHHDFMWKYFSSCYNCLAYNVTSGDRQWDLNLDIVCWRSGKTEFHIGTYFTKWNVPTNLYCRFRPVKLVNNSSSLTSSSSKAISHNKIQFNPCLTMLEAEIIRFSTLNLKLRDTSSQSW